MRGDIDVAAVGALVGEPARAAALIALTDGRALAATTLAAEAQVAPSTLSGHLNRLGAALLDTLIARGWVCRGERRVVHITDEGYQALSEQLQVDAAALAS